MFFPLMLLETAPSPFSSSDYIFERKYDGIRLEYSNIDEPKLYTRNQSLVNRQFPELLFPFDESIILDGEVVSMDSKENEDFEKIIRRFFMKNQAKILQQAKASPVTYLIFDILYYQGNDLRNVPLIERKEILSKLQLPYANILVVPFVEVDGLAFFDDLKRNHREGMVAKKKNSLYLGKRSNNWLKVIHWVETEAIISGYQKKDKALLCTHLDGSPLGIIQKGMSSNQRQAFFTIAEKIFLKEDSDFVYLQPVIKCKLKGRGFVSSGALRSASFVDFIL